jgi:hypothetical protein
MLNENLSKVTEPDYKPHKLIALANKQKVGNISLCILGLREKINNDRINEITFIEWLWCIDNDQPWQKISELEQIQLSEKIWNVSLKIDWLYSTLIRRLAWFYTDKKDVIASSLINGFKIWSGSSFLEANLAINIIVALEKYDPKQELVKITCNQNLTRNELLRKINNVLPNIPILQDYVIEIAPYFHKIHPVTLDKVNWLLRCFDEIDEKIQITSVDYILSNVSTSIADTFPELVNWLKKNYNNSQKQSELSPLARQKLRNWIGSINYQDFHNLVNLIINKISLSSTEEKQLKNRQSFWANYSNSFARLKILLPSQSYEIINNNFREDQDIQKLESDGSEPTEVCIFDLGDKGFIVEFFRGKGSETRLFPQKDYIEQFLFGEESLSVKKIRVLGGEAHDHVYCWQWACEKWLREKYNISPNPATKFFIIVSIHYIKQSIEKSDQPILRKNQSKHYEENRLEYNSQYGLSQPSSDKLKRRERNKIRWLNEIRKLELDATQSHFL